MTQIEAYGRIQHLNVAEVMSLRTNVLLWMPLGTQGIYELMDM